MKRFEVSNPTQEVVIIVVDGQKYSIGGGGSLSTDGEVIEVIQGEPEIKEIPWAGESS